MIKNNRMDALVEKTKGINTLLDIGCDHGLVILKAFEEGNIKKAIASDINIEPLNNAKDNLVDYPVEFILGDGFKQVKSEFDGVVIAGMGSNLISSILENAPKDENIKYVLQANNKYERLRYFLVNNNFKIVDEELIYDKHYYVLITAVRGTQTLSEEEMYLGPILMNKKSSVNYYKHVYNHYQNLYKKHKVDNFRFEKYINFLSKVIDKYN